MTSTTRNSGFYATETETYYQTPMGRVFTVASPDFDGVRSVAAIPAAATPADGLLTPEEAIDFCRQVEALCGETLIETA